MVPVVKGAETVALATVTPPDLAVIAYPRAPDTADHVAVTRPCPNGVPDDSTTTDTDAGGERVAADALVVMDVLPTISESMMPAPSHLLCISIHRQGQRVGTCYTAANNHCDRSGLIICDRIKCFH